MLNCLPVFGIRRPKAATSLGYSATVAKDAFVLCLAFGAYATNALGGERYQAGTLPVNAGNAIGLVVFPVGIALVFQLSKQLLTIFDLLQLAL